MNVATVNFKENESREKEGKPAFLGRPREIGAKSDQP